MSNEADGLLTEHATPTSRALLPAQYCLEPSIYGGILTQLASNGAGVAQSSGQRNMIIAYKLGATGKLPDTVGA